MFKDPLKEQVFRALVETGNLESFGISASDIMDMTEQDAIKTLNLLGIRPELINVKKEYIKKNIGGIVSLNQMTRPVGYR